MKHNLQKRTVLHQVYSGEVKNPLSIYQQNH